MVIHATYKHGTIPAVIMVAIATAFFIYLQITTPKKIPAFATKELVGTVQNKKFCPKPILTKEQLMKMKQEDGIFNERMKEQFENTPIGKTLGDITSSIDKKTNEAIEKSTKTADMSNNTIITPVSLPTPNTSLTVNDTITDNAPQSSTTVTNNQNKIETNPVDTRDAQENTVVKNDKMVGGRRAKLERKIHALH